MKKVLSMVLAGGEGRRLGPLTEIRAKPSVPFGGSYRIIDFVLSNFVNSDLHKIYVLTQFKSHSLMKHLRMGWRFSGIADQFVDPIPAQMRTGKKWYEGTADAIYQNLNLIHDEDSEIICVFGGDHIYKMDIRQMIQQHEEKKAKLTVAAIPVPVKDAHHFGVIQVDDEWRMTGFQEKPQENPATIPGDPSRVLASMGNYVFQTKCLIDELNIDVNVEESSHDFGKNIIPRLFPQGEVFVYDFFKNRVPGSIEGEPAYWRDVGTIDSYWESSMDLISIKPTFNLYNSKWPILTYTPPLPPAKFVHFSDLRTGHAINSIISPGCIVSGSLVEESVIGFGVRANSFSHIKQSVIMDNVEIGRGSKIKKAIIDKDVKIPPGTIIGENPEDDRKRFFTTESGIVVIPKGKIVE
ncbi:glucose-1-phosphate adenylyltransferase [Deltaproteobacteria bacterium TL4]